MISFNIKTDVQSNEQLATILTFIALALPTDAIRGDGHVHGVPFEWEAVALDA